MKAWKLVSPNKLELITQEPTELTQPKTAKVKIEKALLSASDYNYLTTEHTDLPEILGRYAVGVVSRTYDDETDLNKADRVVISPAIPCQECIACKSGHTEHCENLAFLGLDIDGVYRDFIDLPIASLHKLPDVVPLEKALFTGHISLSLNILDTLNIEKGDHIAIFSETKVGLIIAQLITYYGAIPILIDKNEDTLQKAHELGIFYTFNYTDNHTFKDDMFNITSGRMCEKVIYLTNSNYPLNDILDICSHGAMICLALNTQKKTTIDLTQLIKKQIRIYSVNTYEGNFPSAINILATSKIDTSCMVGTTIKFNELGKQIDKIDFNELKHKNVIIDID